jgi:hypothetical protein
MRDHPRSVFQKSAHMLVSQAISNGRIRASNEYLETFEGQQLGSLFAYFVSTISNVQLNVCRYPLLG